MRQSAAGPQLGMTAATLTVIESVIETCMLGVIAALG